MQGISVLPGQSGRNGVAVQLVVEKECRLESGAVRDQVSALGKMWRKESVRK